MNEWAALQPLLERWKVNPQSAAQKDEVIAILAATERHANLLASDLQSLFEDRMQQWANRSLFLNRLLTLGSFSFVVIILLMTYVIYLFFQNQALNERVLRTSEQRLRVILDAIPDAVYRVSSAGIYTDYKPAAKEAHRFPGETFYNKHLHDVLPAEVAHLLQEGIHSVLASGQQQLLEYPLSDALTNRVRHYEARLLPSGNDEVQLIVRDITDVKQQEEAALQAQKLESLGILAGGIAHDFNNLLTGMLGQASLAAAKLNRGLPALDHIQKVVISAERAADLTRQLLAYTGKGKFQIDPLDLNQLMRDTAALLGTVLPNQANLVMTLQDNLPSVHVDRGQIQQVVMNLFINAIEALPEGKGTITISTDTQEIADLSTINPGINPGNNQVSRSAQVSSSSELAAGSYVVLHVVDSGIGMDQSTLSRIFDPFFSTKPKGHGLGLSATLGIIRTHQGALHVQSQPACGTAFTMLLPAHPAQHLLPTAESALSTPVPNKAQQTILIIDDEATVREVATDILAAQGFHVTTAANGHEGIACFRMNFQTIDLVLLDLKMPGLTGTETYQTLQQIQPALKVIFTSGYSDAAVNSQISQSASITFLPKPYTVESLTRQVHDLLAL
jgi:signal transduction histidine kinase